MSSDFGVIVHGGAGGAQDKSEEPERVQGLREAVDCAWKLLVAGADGMEAVAAALRVLEENQLFNAGFGAYLNVDGKVFQDIGLMRGSGEFTSVMNIPNLKFPSALACDLLKKGELGMRVWCAELDDFVRQAPAETQQRYGLVRDPRDLIAPYAEQVFQRYKRRQSGAQDPSQASTHQGTVGCLVRTKQGRLFAGTSTGGTLGKPPGRVGDSPIIGAGVYADDSVCALSATGHGESILRANLSGGVIGAIKAGLKTTRSESDDFSALLTDIINAELANFQKMCGAAPAGLIVYPRKGRPLYGFVSKTLNVGLRHGEGPDSFVEDIQVASRP